MLRCSRRPIGQNPSLARPALPGITGWFIPRPAPVRSGSLSRPIRHDPGGRLSQVADDGVRIHRCRFRIAAVDEDGPAAGPAPRLHVAPPVPDHDAAPEVQFQVPCGLEQHARTGFPAITSICIVVRADVDRVDGQGPQEDLVEFVDHRSVLHPSGDIRLVRHDQEDESGSAECLTGFRHPRQDAELFECRRRIGPTVADDRPVEHAVTIQENGSRRLRKLRLVTTAFQRGRRRAWRRVTRAAPPSYPWHWTSRACESARCSGGRPERHPSIHGHRR